MPLREELEDADHVLSDFRFYPTEALAGRGGARMALRLLAHSLTPGKWHLPYL